MSEKIQVEVISIEKDKLAKDARHIVLIDPAMHYDGVEDDLVAVLDDFIIVSGRSEQFKVYEVANEAKQ